MNPIARLPKSIFERFVAGESIESLADDFDIDATTCEDLLRTHCAIMALPKSKATFNKLLSKFVRGQVSSMNLKAMNFAASYAYHYNMELPDWFRQEYTRVAKDVVKNALILEKQSAEAKAIQRIQNPIPDDEWEISRKPGDAINISEIKNRLTRKGRANSTEESLIVENATSV